MYKPMFTVGFIGVSLAGLATIRDALAIVGWAVVVLAALAGLVWLAEFSWRKWYELTVVRSQAQRERNQTDFQYAIMLAQGGQVQAGLIYAKHLADVGFSHHAPAQADPQQLALPAPDPVDNEQPLPVLAELLTQAQRVLISGGQNAGKTTVCQWIAHNKLEQGGRVIVIDSHATPARWPLGCEVIGAGRDHQHIERLLQWLMKEMDRRFLEQAQGIVEERGHEIISIVSDEWTLLPQIIPSIERYTVPLLTETRKAGFDFYLAAHDTTVATLGIKGRGGLRRAFDFAVLCDYDFESGERHTFVNFMKSGTARERDNIEYEAPGPFVSSQAAATLSLPAGPSAPPFGLPEPANAKPTGDEEAAIIGFHMAVQSERFSWRKATQNAFGEGRFGSTYTIKLKKILDQFEIDYSKYSE